MESTSSEEISNLRDEMSLLWKEINELRKSNIQLQVKVTEYDSQFAKYGDSMKVTKDTFDAERRFVVKMLEKYADITNNHNDGLKASSFALIVEVESGQKIYRNKVKSIMESFTNLEKGAGSLKQEKMNGGIMYYRGLRSKPVYANLPEDRESLTKAIKSNTLPQLQSNSPRNISLPQLDLQSPIYNGASSPAPVMARQ